MFWKTRLERVIDGASTRQPHARLLQGDPLRRPSTRRTRSTWTGTWRDPRFSPPADGGTPENALTGQSSWSTPAPPTSRCPAAYAQAAASGATPPAPALTGGPDADARPGTGTLGYEWDVDADNGFRPRGLVRACPRRRSAGSRRSPTTAAPPSNRHRDAQPDALPRAQRRAGLRRRHRAVGLGPGRHERVDLGTDPAATPTRTCSRRRSTCSPTWACSRATLLRRPGRGATQSTDTTAPTATITSPAHGASLRTAASVDDLRHRRRRGRRRRRRASRCRPTAARRWHPATGTTSWTYTWIVHGSPTATIKVRAVDDSGNLGTPGSGVTVNVSCPCSLWGRTRPSRRSADSGDANAGRARRQVQVRRRSAPSTASASTSRRPTPAPTSAACGPPTGQRAGAGDLQRRVRLRLADGDVLAARCRSSPNTTYVASYFAPNGHYAATPSTSTTPGAVRRQHARQPAAARAHGQRHDRRTASTTTAARARSRRARTARPTTGST